VTPNAVHQQPRWRCDPNLLDRGYHVGMTERTTVDIDPELLEQAREVLGETTSRGTVEEALRRVANRNSIKGHSSAVSQRRYFEQLSAHADLSILASEQMWR